MELSEAHLRYLLAIYEVSQKEPNVSSQRVAQLLGVTKPSVVHILDALMEKNLAVKERYGKIYLTDKGIFAVRFYLRLMEQVLACHPLHELNLSETEQKKAAFSMVISLPCRYFAQAYQEVYGEEDTE